MAAARPKEQLYSLVPFLRYAAVLAGNAMAPVRQSTILKQIMRKFDVFIVACLVAINEAINKALQVTMNVEIARNMMLMSPPADEVESCIAFSSGGVQPAIVLIQISR